MISYDQYLQFSPYFAYEDAEKDEDRLNFLKSFNSSPQKIKELLASMDATEQIINISTTFGLDEFYTEFIAYATRKIATGEIFIGDAADYISNKEELPIEIASQLLGSLVKDVLAPAIEDIKKIQAGKFPNRIRPSTLVTPVMPTPPKFTSSPNGNPNPNNVVDLRNR